MLNYVSFVLTTCGRIQVRFPIIDAQGQHYRFLGPIAQSEFSNILERGRNEWRYRVDDARNMTPAPDLAPMDELSRVVPEAGFHASLMYERRGSCTLTSA